MSYPQPGQLELKVDNLQPDDMSYYTCQSTNVAGTRELTGKITVNCKSRFHVNNEDYNRWFLLKRFEIFLFRNACLFDMLNVNFKNCLRFMVGNERLSQQTPKIPLEPV
jgi:hypothetical protein